ncbi:MAG: GBS Bsp-like repeat-containing protein, partial [Firmicutes bacterium]|nr:GBS Bsp-like repeat-containing protein [Bacillota bacterium]
DTVAPTISNVVVSNISSEGYTVTCKVTDNIGVEKVVFPSWTSQNGQDDIQPNWQYNSDAYGTINSNGNVTYRVNVSDHNYETGCEYNTHIYAYDEVGNVSSTPAPVTFVPFGDNKIAGYSLSLSGDIGVNFYMTFSPQTIANAQSKIRFILPNGTIQDTYVKDAQREEDYYIFPCRVSAKDMTKTITAELLDGEGNAIKTFKYTVEEYADYLISHASSYDAKSINIAKAMMTYGKYVQQYFGYNTSNVPKNVNSLANVDLSQYQAIINDKNNQINFVGAQLLLTSKPGLQLYFTGDAQFKVNGESVEVSKSGKYTVVTIPSIASMDELFMITAPNFAMRYGIFSYGYHALSQSTNTSLKNLVKAMYAYHQALYN